MLARTTGYPLDTYVRSSDMAGPITDVEWQASNYFVCANDAACPDTPAGQSILLTGW